MTNIYNITPSMVEEVENVHSNPSEESKTKSYIPAGIRENLKLDGIVQGKGNNDNNFLAFNFSDDDGNTFSHTEWEINQGSEEEKVSKANNQRKRIVHILTGSKFLTTLNVQANDFIEFGTKLIAALGDNHKGKKVRAKIVYNKKNFTTFPSYVTWPFIESMDVSKEDSKLKELGIDKFIKSEYKPDNEFSSSSTNLDNSVSNATNLPF